MWLFTKYGFFSVVCARDTEDNPDRGLIMIRARVKHHLEKLKEEFPVLLSRCQIQKTIETDYRYRIIIEKPVGDLVIFELAKRINYSNFKSEVSKTNKTKDKSYEKALHDVWAIMNRLQK